MIRPFFRNVNFKCEWSSDILEASKHRKHKFDPSLQGRKADFSIYVPVRGKKFYLFTSEIKSADYMLSSKSKITPEYCDLVKLGNDIIDKCIDDGVNESDPLSGPSSDPYLSESIRVRTHTKILRVISGPVLLD